MEQLELSYTDGKNINVSNHFGLLKLKIYIHCDPEIPRLGIYPTEMHTYMQKMTYIRLFTAALFVKDLN